MCSHVQLSVHMCMLKIYTRWNNAHTWQSVKCAWATKMLYKRSCTHKDSFNICAHSYAYAHIPTHTHTHIYVYMCIYVCEYPCVFACIRLLVSLLEDDRRRSDLIWSRLSLRNLLARTEGRVEYWILHTTWPPLYLIFRGNYSPTDLAKWNPFEAKTGRNLEINLQLAL